MKKIIIALMSLLTVGTVIGQQGRLQKATGYTKDGTLFYQVSGCKPSSQLEFYSTPSGGKLLATADVDEQGNVLVEVPKSIHYAFALNRVSATKGGDAGVAYYVSLGQPVLQLRSVKNDGGETLNWEVVSKSNTVTCDVFSSNNGTAFVKEATLRQKDAVGNVYEYTGTPATTNTAYYIQVNDAANNLRIPLGKAKLSAVGAVKVSPTVFTDVLNVQLLTAKSGVLQVFNSNGVLVHSTVVKQGNNAVDLAKIAPANYIIRVNDNNSCAVYTGRVIKGQ